MRAPWRVAVLAAFSCAHAPPVATGAWHDGIRGLAGEVAAARGVPRLRDFELVVLDEVEFVDRYVELGRAQGAGLGQEIEATLRALGGLDGKLAGAGAQARVRAVLDEQIVAFYDFDRHTMFVRRVLPPQLADGLDDDTVLTLTAHELGHVLQDQWHVRHPVTSYEQALAQRAVLEGDATLTALLTVAARKRVPPVRAVERTRLVSTTVTDAQQLELSGSERLLAATPTLQALFTFPCLRGQRFIADVYRAGGLPLVEQVLAHPPQRTDAIFEPQRWLDGGPERLVPFADGTRHGGALLLRAMVAQCAQREPEYGPMISKVLSGLLDAYRDDRFVLGSDGTLTWELAFDPRLTDTQVRATLPGLVVCFGRDPKNTAISGERGLYVLATGPDRQRAEALAASAPVALDKPRAPPFGPQTVPAISRAVAYREAGRGSLEGNRWSSPKLAMQAVFAPGLKLQTPEGVSLLVGSPRAVVVASFLDEAPTAKIDDGFVNGFLLGMLKKKPPKGITLRTHHRWQEVQLARGAAREARVDLPEVVGPVRARLIPLCGGRAAFYVVGVPLEPEGSADIDAAFEALQGPDGEPPLCAEK